MSLTIEVPTNLGRVSLVPRGEYNPVTVYARLDVVQYEGCGYIALRTTQGVSPADGLDWMLVAEKGDSGSATLAESWTHGNTGARPGEDTDNAEYWARQAQAALEQATVPATVGVYNIVLTDRQTNERYALLVENGRLMLLGVSDELEATSPLLIDRTNGIAYALAVENGRLLIKEAV